MNNVMAVDLQFQKKICNHQNIGQEYIVLIVMTIDQKNKYLDQLLDDNKLIQEEIKFRKIYLERFIIQINTNKNI